MNLIIPKRLIKKNKKINVSAEELIEFEKNVKKSYLNGEIRRPIHLSGGNEQELIEIFKYIGQNDCVFSTWRNHYHAILHGITKDEVMKQIKTTGSMNMSSTNPFFLCSSIVGGIIPISLGCALAIKRKKLKKKVWCFIGDMAANSGIFSESYRYAKNYSLPIEFVIEDNLYSVDVPTNKVWSQNKPFIPKEVIYFKYKLKYPHHGVGKFVAF